MPMCFHSVYDYYCECHVSFGISMTAAGNVMDKVIIDKESESTVVFGQGGRSAYIGYLTIKVRGCVTVISNASSLLYARWAYNCYLFGTTINMVNVYHCLFLEFSQLSPYFYYFLP